MTYKNYTITGSPTITDNGIVSNLSDANYITCNNGTFTANNITIYAEFNTGNLSSSQFSALFNFGVDIGATNNGILFEAANNYNGGGKPRVIFATGVDSTGSTGTFFLDNVLQANTDYSLKVEYKNSLISAYIYDVNGNIASSKTNSSLVPATLKFLPCIIGREKSSNRNFPGSLDFKRFRVEVDGKVIYQAYSDEFKPINRVFNRHDTASNFSTNNPVLGDGEVAVETDTSKVKVGDGNTAYNTLPYVGGGITSQTVSSIASLTQDQYDALVQAGTVDPNTLYIIIPTSNS